MTEQEVRQQTENVWDAEWGEIEDYGLAFDIEELNSFRIGDKIVVIVDEAEDPGMPGSVSGYESDEGVVVGFAAPRPGGGPFGLPQVSYLLYVSIEDMEPAIFSPRDLDHLA